MTGPQAVSRPFRIPSPGQIQRKTSGSGEDSRAGAHNHPDGTHRTSPLSPTQAVSSIGSSGTAAVGHAPGSGAPPHPAPYLQTDPRACRRWLWP